MGKNTDGAGRKKGLGAFYALAASNLFMLGLALFRGWEAAEILVLYWAESGIVAAFAVLKILFAGYGGTQGLSGDALKFHLSKLLAAPLTVFMYAMVMAVIWLFMSVILSVAGGTEIGSPRDISHLKAGILALAAGHAAGFVKDYLAGGGYRNASLKDLVVEPAPSMAALYFALLIGAAVISMDLIASNAALVTAFVAVRMALGLWPLARGRVLSSFR